MNASSRVFRAAAVFAGALPRFVSHNLSQYRGAFFKLPFGNHILDMGFRYRVTVAADAPPQVTFRLRLKFTGRTRVTLWRILETLLSFRTKASTLLLWQKRGSPYFRAVESCSRRFVGGRWRQAVLWAGSRNGANGFSRFWMV